MPKFRVAVTCDDRNGKRRYRAYAPWLDASWPFRLFEVVADDGPAAKAVAVALAKKQDARIPPAPTEPEETR